MGKLSRDKGARIEREIVNLLITEGLDAVRVPLSGATAYAKGDIDIRFEAFTLVGEVKARKVFPTWLEAALGENDWLCVRPDRQAPMVILPFWRFAWLLRKAGGLPEPEKEAAEPELPTWDDLLGAAPDATGDLSSEDFVARLRDSWR